MIKRKICVCKRLSLNALRCVNNEYRTLASGERTRNLVVKIDMARGVNEIELIHFAVFCLVVKLNGVRLDGDAALTLKLHIIKDLSLHITLCNRACKLQKSVGKR